MVDFSVILVEPKYDGNIGRVARVMKNFGFEKLILVNPPEITGEARKNAMHALDVLNSAEKVDSLEQLRKKFGFLVATSAKIAGDKNNLRTPVPPEELSIALSAEGDVGIVFGREDYGLLNDEILLCDMNVTIPANPEYPTLNIAQSVGVILYELSRGKMRGKLTAKKFKMLNYKEKEILLKYFDELSDKLYDLDFENRLVKKTFRQLLARAFVSGREATTLIGLFRRASENTEKK